MTKRNTKQKAVINAILANAFGPLSTQEIFEVAKKKVPGLGVATVYRNIKLLLEENRIKAVSLPDEMVRYEASDKWAVHHHHFQCLGCLKVFDIDICDSDFKSKVPKGFKVNRHEVMLWGYCNESTCNKEPQH